MYEELLNIPNLKPEMLYNGKTKLLFVQAFVKWKIREFVF